MLRLFLIVRINKNPSTMQCPHCSLHTNEPHPLPVAAEPVLEMWWPQAWVLRHRKTYRHVLVDPNYLHPNTRSNRQTMRHTWCYHRLQLRWHCARVSLAQDQPDSKERPPQLAHFRYFPNTTQCRRSPIRMYAQHLLKFLLRNAHR